MFRRARLRLTALYIALMGVTLALVAAGILLLGVQQARRTEDQSLRLRAESLANLVRRPGGPPFVSGQGGPFGGGGGQGGGQGAGQGSPASAGVENPDPGRPPERIEQQGILDYQLFVQGGRVRERGPGSFAGLPNIAAAQAAVDAGTPRFQTLSLDAGAIRVFSMPVSRDGQPIAVVQVARSQYFVNETVKRLIIVVAGVGSLGLLLSSGAAFWLAGRTLAPIAGALQRQRDFTADASHELRTPLSLVRGNAELLLRHPEKPISEYADAVQDVVDESDRLTRLVTSLLTLARADSGHLKLAHERVDLSGLATGLARDLRPLAEAKGLTLAEEVAPERSVLGDRDRLRELGVILLENAIRYTEAGSVLVRVDSEGSSALMTVSDTGPGIAREHLPRIFERFYRTDAARSTEEGGAGLGLAIAQWIAEAHGGRITVSSTPGAGSAFNVRLPLAPAPRS